MENIQGWQSLRWSICSAHGLTDFIWFLVFLPMSPSRSGSSWPPSPFHEFWFLLVHIATGLILVSASALCCLLTSASTGFVAYWIWFRQVFWDIEQDFAVWPQFLLVLVLSGLEPAFAGFGFCWFGWVLFQLSQTCSGLGSPEAQIAFEVPVPLKLQQPWISIC